jgi:hypothetical protein
MNDPKQIEKLHELIIAAERFNPNSSLGAMMVQAQAQALMKGYAIIRFFEAVEKRELDVIKSFMEKGIVDINVKTPMFHLTRATTALGIAIAQGNSEEIIKYLLAKGADPKLAFDDFKRAANIDDINQLIKIAPDSVPKEFYESKQLVTLRFCTAVEKQDLATVKDLIGKVDINAKENIYYNKAAFDIAVNQGNNKEILDYLLANGAKDDDIEPLGIVFENPEE